MDSLRLKLEKRGLTNVAYMVVNHQGEASQRLHSLLRAKVSENITLYQQVPGQVDVWQTLSGEKDDFLIYDRCGRLTNHIALPYSILSTPYVEEAIRDAYCKNMCGSCKYEKPEQQEACNRTVEAEPEEEVTVPPEVGGAHGHGRHHGHEHGQHHGHEHGQHHGHEHGHGRQHTHDGHHGSSERQGQGAGGQHQHQHHAPEEHGHPHGHARHHVHSQGQVHVSHDLTQRMMGDQGQALLEGAPESPQRL